MKDTSKVGADIKFYYINDRPVDMVKLTRMINEVFKVCNDESQQFSNANLPSAIINFKLSNKSIDINLTPDKRTIFIKDEQSVLDVLKDALMELWKLDNSRLDMTPNQQSTNIKNYLTSSSSSSKKRRLSDKMTKMEISDSKETIPSLKKIQTDEKELIEFKDCKIEFKDGKDNQKENSSINNSSSSCIK